MRIRNHVWLLIGAWLARPAFADPVQTLDLKSLVGPTPIERAGAAWAMPQGRQVLDGIPFEMAGTVLVQGTNALQLELPKAANGTVPGSYLRFERIHLLGAADADGAEGGTLANVRVVYADGTDSVLPVRFGEQVRGWTAPWHKPAAHPLPPEVWRGQHSSAALSDKYLRLYHVTLANPSPDKEVRSLALESAATRPHLMVMAVSVGPAAPDALADTVNAPKNPFPDLRPSTGEPARAEGIVKSLAGEPLSGAHVRVLAAREFNTADRESSITDPAAGTMAETGPDGRFILPPLPDNKLYRLGVMADGFEFATYRGADPKSDPVEIRLKPSSAESNTGKFAVHVKVTGPDGQALAFATVETAGVGTGGGTSWGGSQSFPEEVLTDTNGEFILARKERFDRLQVKISAPGLAIATIWLPETNGLQTVKLGVGAELRGRVMKEGKPLAGVRLGISGQERNMEVYAGSFEAQTDTNGVFVFAHLPPDVSWMLCGLMNSFKSYGALPPRTEVSGPDGGARDLGDLEVVPGVHLAGQVKTRNGGPLPDNLRVYARYEDAMDSQSAELDASGRFRFDGLSKRTVAVSCFQSGWRLSWENRNLDMNPGTLIGQLEGDKDDLLVVIEKGESQFNNNGTSNGQLPPQDEPRARPLYGAETSGPPSLTLAGQVLDDKTGQPILKYKIVPGRKPPVTPGSSPPQSMLQHLLEPFAQKVVPWNERIYWDQVRSENITNGTFSMNFMVLTSQPVLQIEAPGYEPLETDAISQTATNLVLRLKAGAGPSGVVLLPDGRPAAGAQIVYGVSQEQFYMTGITLNSYGNNRSVFTTGNDGKFSFELKSQGKTIFVAHPAGWAQEPVDKNGGVNARIKLKPWATVTGILVDSNNVPLAGTTLHLTMFHDWQRGGALVNLQEESVTDAQGHFTFSKVPPDRLELERAIRFGTGGGYSYQLQTWLVPEAGVLNDLGKITLDHPPPEPVFEQLKQRFGP